MPACSVSNQAQDCSHQAVVKLLQDILLPVPVGEAEGCAGPTAQQHLPEAAPSRHAPDGHVPTPAWWTNGPNDAQALHSVALAKSRNDSNQSETSVATAECVGGVGLVLRIVRNCHIELRKEAPEFHVSSPKLYRDTLSPHMYGRLLGHRGRCRASTMSWTGCCRAWSWTATPSAAQCLRDSTRRGRTGSRQLRRKKTFLSRAHSSYLMGYRAYVPPVTASVNRDRDVSSTGMEPATWDSSRTCRNGRSPLRVARWAHRSA